MSSKGFSPTPRDDGTTGEFRPGQVFAEFGERSHRVENKGPTPVTFIDANIDHREWQAARGSLCPGVTLWEGNSSFTKNCRPLGYGPSGHNSAIEFACIFCAISDFDRPHEVVASSPMSLARRQPRTPVDRRTIRLVALRIRFCCRNWFCLAGAMEELGRKPDRSEFIETWAFVSPAVFAYCVP
jgi:hypothetical protein